MTQFRSLISFTAAAVLALASLPALALDLATARTQGLVGETPSGYVAVVDSSSNPPLSELVSSVNAKRKAEYERIAKQNGQTPDVVGQLAFEQIVSGLPAGALYAAPGGGWKRK